MLKAKLQEQQIAAMKAGETAKLEIIRYILAQIKNKEIEKKEDLKDDETGQIVKKVVKELKESLEQAQKADRADLVAKHEEEIKIASEYLPAEISDEALEKAVKALVESHKEEATKNPKAIIGICMRELRAQADPSRIMAALKKLEASV